MASSSKLDINKILAARNTKVQIDHLKFELKQRDQKVEKLRQKINHLEQEIQELKKQS